MPTPFWPRYAALPLLLSALLTSCSMPDGPNPEAANPMPAPEAIATDSIALNGPGQLLPITATAEIKGQLFDLEVAQTQPQQALGLMFRSALPDDRGMLFPFAPPRRTSFWMKDVPVPLDMVFIREGEVVAIASQVPPCPALPCPAYGPRDQIIDQVLELRSGRAAEIGLQAGDSVIIRERPAGE